MCLSILDRQGQTDAIDRRSGESAVILSGEHMKDIEQEVLEKPTLSIRCKTPVIFCDILSQ